MKYSLFLVIIFLTVNAFAQPPKKRGSNDLSSNKQSIHHKFNECKIYSDNRGHNLNVDIDVYVDSIIKEKQLIVTVTDSNNNKRYNYLIKTNDSLVISSYGANGPNGSNGFDGNNGLDGLAGFPNSESQSVTDSEGNLSVIYVTVQGRGGDGSDGSDGQNGDNGGNGYDGGNINIRYTKLAEPYLPIIKAYSIAGKGGYGGSGGRGGKGGSGGQGNPSGNSGNDGHEGYSGSNGASGQAGKIIYIPLQSH